MMLLVLIIAFILPVPDVALRDWLNSRRASR